MSDFDKLIESLTFDQLLEVFVATCLGPDPDDWADQERFESELLRCDRPYNWTEEEMDRIPF